MKELPIKDFVKKVVKMFSEVHWYSVWIPSKDFLEQQFMKVTKLKPSLCTNILNFAKILKGEIETLTEMVASIKH